MCNPISLILTEDKVFLPSDSIWDHSHSSIMKKHKIPDGLMGDKYLRLEVVPPDGYFRDKKTNKKLSVNKKWKVILDEENIPDWYKNDKPNQEDRAREAANKWFQKFPDNLLDGYKETAGDNAKINARYNSVLIAGHCSRLTADESSVLTAGDNSVLNAGDSSVLNAKRESILNAGYYSVLNAGNYSELTAGNGSTLTSLNYSKLTAGDNSDLIAGDNSVLKALNNSTLIAGNFSTLTAEKSSILEAGNDSIFCAGKDSVFILYWDDGNKRRAIIANVGENGIKPNKKYLGINGKFTEVKK